MGWGRQVYQSISAWQSKLVEVELLWRGCGPITKDNKSMLKAWSSGVCVQKTRTDLSQPNYRRSFKQPRGIPESPQPLGWLLTHLIPSTCPNRPSKTPWALWTRSSPHKYVNGRRKGTVHGVKSNLRIQKSTKGLNVNRFVA